MTKAINNIGVLTSGGDSPGMNAAIRAVVRTALQRGLKVTGIRRGYEGMIEGDMVPLDTASVGNIIHRGGTILRTARSKRFLEAEGRSQALAQLERYGVDALVVIGGDGTFCGAHVFWKETGLPVVGLPGTIDNDLAGTDLTIGYDTALNTVVEAVDKIRDTADSTNYLFLVEVMGKDAGFIALNSAIAGGAEAVLIPETKTDINALVERLHHGWRNNKTTNIVIVAEGDDFGGAAEVAEVVRKEVPQYNTRVTILGHIQRGGNPSCRDRVLASRLGFEAVQALLDGRTDTHIGLVNNEVLYTPFEQAVKSSSKLNMRYLELAEILGK